MLKPICVIIITSLALTSCNSGSGTQKQGIGTAVGALAGGLLGSRFGKGGGQLLATGVGALAGAAIGNSIGKSLDAQDKMMLERSSHKALEYGSSGSQTEWRNPDSGNYGYITPSKAYRDGAGAYCREYTQVIVIGDKEEKAYGRACRQPDGQWQIVQ